MYLFKKVYLPLLLLVGGISYAEDQTVSLDDSYEAEESAEESSRDFVRCEQCDDDDDQTASVDNISTDAEEPVSKEETKVVEPANTQEYTLEEAFNCGVSYAKLFEENMVHFGQGKAFETLQESSRKSMALIKILKKGYIGTNINPQFHPAFSRSLHERSHTAVANN